jgi:hypothetical protein
MQLVPLHRGARHLRLRTELALDAAEDSAAAGLAAAEAALAGASTREDLDAAAAALLPRGWVLDERGDAVPRGWGSGDDDVDSGGEGGGGAGGGRGGRRRGDWTPKIGSTVIVRQLGGAEAEVVGLDTGAGEVLVKMGSITTRAPLAGVSPA